MDLDSLLSQRGFWVLFALECSSGHVLLDQSGGDWLIFSFLFLDSIEFSDIVGSFWTQSSWDGSVSKSRNLLFTFFNNGDWQRFDIRADDASSYWFSFSLSSSFSSVSSWSWSEEKFNSWVGEDTLFHGKSVSIITSLNFEDISLKFVS